MLEQIKFWVLYLCTCQILLEGNSFSSSYTSITETKQWKKLRPLSARIWTFLCLKFSMRVRQIIASVIPQQSFSFLVLTYPSRDHSASNSHWSFSEWDQIQRSINRRDELHLYREKRELVRMLLLMGTGFISLQKWWYENPFAQYHFTDQEDVFWGLF